MLWLLGIAIFIVFWFVFPPFRKFALIVGGIIVLGILLLIFWSDQQQQAAKSLIPTNQIAISNLQLGQQYGSYALSGEVTNNSDHELTGITLDVKAYDCPGSSITSNCTTIGEDQSAYFFTNIPSGQERSISDSFVSFGDMPPVQGQFLWSYTITGTTGQ